jgi:chromosome segregation ATPase
MSDGDELFKTTAFGGYDKDDVQAEFQRIKDDAYQEQQRLQARLAAVTRELDQTRIRLEARERKLDEMQETLAAKDKELQDMEKTIREKYQSYVDNYETIGSLIYEAKIRAKQTDRETEAQRQRVLADAQADAQRIREEAQAEAQKTLDDVQRQVDEKTREGKLQYIAVQEELSRIVDIFGQVQKQFMNSYRDIQKIVSENPGDSFEALDPYENGEPEMENLEIFTSNDEEVK